MDVSYVISEIAINISTFHLGSYTWLACIAPPISRHVYVYCVNGESQTIIVIPLKLPVSERGDCSGLMLLHERDMRSRDCRGDGGSTAVEECILESLKNMIYEPYPGVSSVIICTVISSHCATNSIPGPYGLEFSWIQCPYSCT